VTLNGFPGLDAWARLVAAEAPHRFGSVVFLRAWAQREHQFGQTHDKWTVRIGQEVMGHLPLDGPALLTSTQTGLAIKVTAKVLPKSEKGHAILEVELPSRAPLKPEPDGGELPESLE
jgi:hypothetical protein